VGDTRSLIIHPASTTHSQLSDDEKIKAGAGPNVIRLSIGLEDVEDIILDIDNSIN
jgi:O-acetylhomoserine (thiol)-lyase